MSVVSFLSHCFLNHVLRDPGTKWAFCNKRVHGTKSSIHDDKRIRQPKKNNNKAEQKQTKQFQPVKPDIFVLDVVVGILPFSMAYLLLCNRCKRPNEHYNYVSLLFFFFTHPFSVKLKVSAVFGVSISF